MRPRDRALRDALAATTAADPDDSFDVGENQENADPERARRGILVRVSPELRRELKIAAINRGLSVQAMMLEAIAEVLNKAASAPKP